MAVATLYSPFAQQLQTMSLLQFSFSRKVRTESFVFARNFAHLSFVT